MRVVGAFMTINASFNDMGKY